MNVIFLISKEDLLFRDQRIANKSCAVQILPVQLHRCDLTVSVGGVIVDTLCGITAAGMEAIGAGTTHGIIHITLTTDGMTLIGDTYMVRDTGRADRDIRRMYGTDRATRPVPTGYLPAVHHSEAA